MKKMAKNWKTMDLFLLRIKRH
uniref:Uncharacterized protein n=1 Tax=Arundo donax TaxID=35708 RepID=A0A0A8YT90_ARUDO